MLRDIFEVGWGILAFSSIMFPVTVSGLAKDGAAPFARHLQYVQCWHHLVAGGEVLAGKDLSCQHDSCS